MPFWLLTFAETQWSINQQKEMHLDLEKKKAHEARAHGSSWVECIREGMVWNTTSEDDSGKLSHKPAADPLSSHLFPQQPLLFMLATTADKGHLQELSVLEDRRHPGQQSPRVWDPLPSRMESLECVAVTQSWQCTQQPRLNATMQGYQGKRRSLSTQCWSEQVNVHQRGAWCLKRDLLTRIDF